MHYKPYIRALDLPKGTRPIDTIKAEYSLDYVAKLASNENLVGPSPKAVAAVQTLIGELNYYPDVTDLSLREALAESFDHQVSADNFVTGNSGCDIIMMLGQCFLREEDEYIICRPTFPVYEGNNRKMGAKAVYVDLDPHDFSLDAEAIIGAITERTRLIYLCSPNNPTGNIIPAAQMDYLVNNVPEHVLIVTDEVYHHFVTSPDYPNSLTYIKQGKNVFIIHSLSKTYGLAGLRVGYGIAPTEIAEYMARFRQPYHINRLSMAGAMAALTDHEHIEKTVSIVNAGKAWLHEQLAALDIQTWPSEANFILFKPPMDPPTLSQKLEERGVMLRPMTGFYLPTHMRVSIGLPEHNEYFIEVLTEILG